MWRAGPASCAVVACSLIACGDKTPRPPPSGASVRVAADYIPPDLDVRLRLDVARIRAALPPESLAQLSGTNSDDGQKPSSIISAALPEADTVWVGVRPSSAPERWDNVVVLEGDFSSIETHVLNQAFHPPRDLGGGLEVRESSHPGSRTDPFRFYSFRDRIWVFGSVAEADALERLIERGRFDAASPPPARGVFSFQAKLRGLDGMVKSLAPSVAPAVRGVETAEGSAEFGGVGIHGSVRLGYETKVRAERAAEVLRQIAKAVSRLGYGSLSVLEVVDQEVVLELEIAPAVVLKAVSAAD